jgi:hypothetical protein
LEIDPNNAFAWLDKGDVLIILTKFVEAIECFDKAIQVDPAIHIDSARGVYLWTRSGVGSPNCENMKKV